MYYTTIMRTTYLVTLFFTSLLIFSLTSCGQSYDKASLQPATHRYTENTASACKQNSRPGKAGVINKLTSKDNLSYNLRTPVNYDATYPHPLLVVYAPAGTSANKSERLTGLTHDATAAGFIIAYIDKVRLTLESLELLGKVPTEIAELWCIDKQQIFYTGHSDGGTISSALTFLQSASNPPAAIVPSAAGLTAKDLAEQRCPTPLSVMVMHNSDDSLFPGYGKQAASWWATCNQCSNETIPTENSLCVEYTNCAENVRTLYCEKPGSHSTWPRINKVLINFLIHTSGHAKDISN